MGIREAPKIKSGCSNGTLPNNVSTSPLKQTDALWELFSPKIRNPSHTRRKSTQHPLQSGILTTSGQSHTEMSPMKGRKVDIQRNQARNQAINYILKNLYTFTDQQVCCKSNTFPPSSLIGVLHCPHPSYDTYLDLFNLCFSSAAS